MERPKRLTAALFDMDGVTIDSEPIKRRNLRQMLARRGIDVALHDLDVTAGANLSDLLAFLQDILDAHGVSEDALSLLRSDRRGGDVYDDPAAVPLPGVVGLVRAFRASGVATALVTTTPAPLVLKALNRNRIVSLYDVIVTGDMVEHAKPCPDPYLRALGLLGVSADEAVAFEDSSSGISSARAAGIHVVAYANPRCSHQHRGGGRGHLVVR